MNILSFLLLANLYILIGLASSYKTTSTTASYGIYNTAIIIQHTSTKEIKNKNNIKAYIKILFCTDKGVTLFKTEFNSLEIIPFKVFQ